MTKPEDRFKGFITVILFAKKITAKTAKKTCQRFEGEELATPERIISAGWNRLVEVLDSGGYIRYDFSTVFNILRIVKEVNKKLGGILKASTM